MRSVGRRDEFAHEVRVAARQAGDAIRVETAVRGEYTDRGRRESLQRKVAHIPRQVAKQSRKRQPPVEFLVTVGEHEDCVKRVDPPRQESHHVERRLIRPVHILDDEDSARHR